MIPSGRLRIGTRDSALALYQAREVQGRLQALGIETDIIEITSDGDIDLVTPLYEMGIQGIFTKSLDVALLQNKIDIAVHSTKDIPTRLAKGLNLRAVLERASPWDCLVLPAGIESIDLSKPCIISTSSLRRKMQWLSRYPRHSTESLRGNIQTRLRKLDESSSHGAIFAQAALDRLGISTHKKITLDWMLPSPSQGAIGVICREDDTFGMDACKAIDHQHTHLCIDTERDFLSALHGGCAVPIAAYAVIEHGEILFKGNVFSLDNGQKCEVAMSFKLDQAAKAGAIAANELFAQGAETIIKSFRPSL